MVATNGLNHETVRLIDELNQANALIGELESRLAGYAHQTAEDSTRLSAATDRLHDQIRRTRMLPLATLFTPLRLQVREMARAAEKQVMLVLDDGGTEADRQVLDRLREVLLHLLRNAVDHGIEPADARIAAGKAPEGRITLRAEVSALSGRGVGLDVVRAQVERMHGRLAVRSAPGAGCSFTLTVPLSLTTSHCLLMRAGELAYALPLDAVQRLVLVGPRDIQILEGRSVLVIEDRPLPLLHLADVLGDRRPAERIETRKLAFLLGGERQVACIVDAVLGEQELVMQRLPAPLQQVRLIGGATILADGSVVPILDAVDLLRAALGVRRAVAAGPVEEAPCQIRTVLVADDSITTRTLEKNILEAAGYRVRLATDGLEALHMLDQLAQDGGCDLLLSDVDMPRLNGFDLTTAVRADPRFRHLPVVLVTSLDTPADRERGIAAGADSYIVKRTFDQRTLIETIAQLI